VVSFLLADNIKQRRKYDLIIDKIRKGWRRKKIQTTRIYESRE
jgi:hypothetical protein